MWAYLHRAPCTVATFLQPQLMRIADRIYQDCTVSPLLHMHMQQPHGSPKLPLVPRMGMDPAVALGYRLTSVCMCKSVKGINALKSHIYLSNTCDPFSNTPPLPFMHTEEAWNKFRGEFIPVKTLQYFLWVLQLRTMTIRHEHVWGTTVMISQCHSAHIDS